MLVMMRVGVLFFASPMDAFGYLPARIRVLVIFVLSIFLLNLAGPDYLASQTLKAIVAEPSMLIWAMGMEFGVGLVLVFALYCAFGALGVAGRLIDAQSGLGAANILNPSTNTDNALTGTILSLLGLSLFFALGGHRYLLQGLVVSLQMIPLGQGIQHLEPGPILAQFGLMFTVGVLIAAPVVVMLLLLDTGIAFMARTMPQMNVYFLFLPLKVLMGFVMLSMTVIYLGPVFNDLFKGVFEFWTELFKSQQ